MTVYYFMLIYAAITAIGLLLGFGYLERKLKIKRRK